MPARAEAIREALEGDGGFTIEGPKEHGTEPIEAVHDPGMVRFLSEAWSLWRTGWHAPEMIPDSFLHPALREGMEPLAEPTSPLARLGYWCFETMTPIVPGTYDAARSAVDVAMTAADMVLGGERIAYGLCRPPGHHSPRAGFGGYCFFNNAAIVAHHVTEATGEPSRSSTSTTTTATARSRSSTARGDVLYASLHGDPDRAYPYFAGYADERGAGPGEGANLNIPLRAGCTDEEYLAAIDRALEEIAGVGGRVLVVSLGLDTYGQDPICDFALTTPVYGEVGRRVAALGRDLIVLQEGGYYLPKLGENVVAWLRGAQGR